MPHADRRSVSSPPREPVESLEEESFSSKTSDHDIKSFSPDTWKVEDFGACPLLKE
jgi:hypothetical protein